MAALLQGIATPPRGEEGVQLPGKPVRDGYIGLLEPGNKVIHPIEGLKGVWVQVIDGNIDVNGEALSVGDAVSLEDEKEVRVATEQGAHFLLFDLV